MVESVHVAPGEGRLIKLPGGITVPPEGGICQRTQFIERLLACGDLVLAGNSKVEADAAAQVEAAAVAAKAAPAAPAAALKPPEPPTAVVGTAAKKGE